MRDVDVARASETDDDVDETVARVASRARASASPSSAVRAVLLRIRRAHWRWSAALSLFAAGVLFATQYGTLEGVRRVMSDGYVTRAASLASTCLGTVTTSPASTNAYRLFRCPLPFPSLYSNGQMAATRSSMAMP